MGKVFWQIDGTMVLGPRSDLDLVLTRGTSVLVLLGRGARDLSK